jgi:hypothetical protein
MKKIYFLTILLCSCGDPKQMQASLKEPMDWLNDPNHLPGADSALVFDPELLPDSGSIAKPVWTTYWYPASQSGTARRPAQNALSPMEKYDQAIGDRSQKATKWEISQSDRFRNVSWAGHCNGVAAAGSTVDEPKKNVFYNNVWFSVDDVKALMVEAFQAGGQVVGGRCDLTERRYDENGRLIATECRDTNAATFHIALTNYIGRFRKPLIADTDSANQVWNEIITSYQVKMKQKLTARDVNWWLKGQNVDGYTYNPNATSFMYYQTEVFYNNGTKKIYEYILELSNAVNILESGSQPPPTQGPSQGPSPTPTPQPTRTKIIGGEWYRNARIDHPDFLWRHTSPMLENPYLSLDVIYKIYNSSL